MSEQRSSYALKEKRTLLDWPSDKNFTILSIDGGGIKGIFPAALLAHIETHLLQGNSAADYFDLITGTSTGGIIALGLANKLTANDMLTMYMERGKDIFPSTSDDWYGKMKGMGADLLSNFLYRYECAPLNALLSEAFGCRRMKECSNRVCIPSFEGKFSEVYIFKTPHHPDYHLDADEKLTAVARATSAAPTFFRPLETGQFTFVDGGVWANNPIMIGIVDVLACFDISPDRIRVLSIDCGESPYFVGDSNHISGGKWQWREVIFAAMHLQSQNALGQAGLLIGPENILRVSPPLQDEPIRLDDWQRACAELPTAAVLKYQEHAAHLRKIFFNTSVGSPIFYKYSWG